ncbi:alkaline shock response membrane anchor protein AmaP [Paenibacillus cymbidii]|uniref:alkaline shock response membrane anchor protein AmaP n=1 Tax=Paenibacillus cymbidii TaxID=1639034 RepID=UPI001081F4BA|nr:alkaline shock response membrane anchor protein AmaP [Paenibacillus cymbidii]
MAKMIDRLLLFIFTVVVIAGAVCLLLAAFGAISYDSSVEFMHKVYSEMNTAVPFIAAVFVLLLIGIRLFYISVRVGGGSNVPSIDQRTEFGDIRISIETVENLALKAASRTRGLKDLRARVNVGSAGIEIVIRSLVDGETSIPELTEEIQRAVKAHLEDITGIPVASVSVYVANVAQASHTFKSRVE